ncbi:hypothetical protein RYH80_09575 [Halobaculum sp. MBLA0147]|uniref:DUF7261 family protein n=1 Tax=Halobaculum sp. MBLA0147 TaxID=3079934 RepID=UPI00352604DE
MTRRRGQLVLVTAALAALALLPVAVAYLQLGAHPDVTARTAPDVGVDGTVRALDRVATDAAWAVSGTRTWANRSAAVAAFGDRFASGADRIATARADETVAVDVTRNTTAARAWATRSCPSGSNRAFGPCRVREGVVVQERVGETAVLAVGVTVRLVAPHGRARVTVVLGCAECVRG